MTQISKESFGGFIANENWSIKMIGVVWGMQGLGFYLAFSVSTFLIKYVEPCLVIFWSMVFASFFNSITPFLEQRYSVTVVGCRFIIGFMEGVCYPAIQQLIIVWSAKQNSLMTQRLLYVNGLLMVVNWPLEGLFCEYSSWKTSSLVHSVITLLSSIFFYVVVRDFPVDHPWIEEEELFYIRGGDRNIFDYYILSKTPYREILSSLPYWSIVIGNFGNACPFFMILTFSNLFLIQFPQVSFLPCTCYCALIIGCRPLGAIFFQQVYLYLHKKEYFSVTTLRRLATIFSHFVPALLFIAIKYLDIYSIVIFLMIAMFCNGAVVEGCLGNLDDLAPNHFDSMHRIMYIFTNSAYFIVPIWIGCGLSECHKLECWHEIFLIASIFYIISGMIFMIFVTSKVQPWNKLI